MTRSRNTRLYNKDEEVSGKALARYRNSATMLDTVTRHPKSEQNLGQNVKPKTVNPKTITDKTNNTPRDCRWRYFREGLPDAMCRAGPADLALSTQFPGILKGSRTSRGRYFRPVTHYTSCYKTSALPEWEPVVTRVAAYKFRCGSSRRIRSRGCILPLRQSTEQCSPLSLVLGPSSLAQILCASSCRLYYRRPPSVDR